MEAFARSSTTLFAKAYTNKPPSPVKALLGRSSISFVRFGNSNANVHRPTSLLRHTAIRSVASSDTRVLRNPDSAGFGIEPAAPSKTVHVRFQLHQKCRYGDNFLLVGNEPIIGQWNPLNAVPLTWSDGNIWTAALDIPIDRAIQFKFILKRSTGDLLWQPGPDRILHTWDTNNIITIAEDWKNVKLHKLTESKSVNQNATPHTNQALTFTDKLTSSNGTPTYSNNNFGFEERGFGSQESETVCMAHDGVCVMTKPTSVGSMEDEDEFWEGEYYDDEYYEDHWEYEDRYEDEEIMFTNDEGRVLVPGLVQGATRKTIDITTDGSRCLVQGASGKSIDMSTDGSPGLLLGATAKTIDMSTDGSPGLELGVTGKTIDISTDSSPGLVQGVTGKITDITTDGTNEIDRREEENS